MRYIVAGVILGLVCIFILSFEMEVAGMALGVLCFFGGILVCVGAQVREDEKYARRMKGRI